MAAATLDRLKGMRVGVFFALLALLYGFGLGGAFGAAEDSIKGHLEREARTVYARVYRSDEAKLVKVTSKSWTYFKRAHLHANALGTAALAMILLLSGIGPVGRLEKLAAALLGIGALGYSSFWMFAGLKAPALGSTGAAKEALRLLAQPTAGACIVGLVLVLFLFGKATSSGDSSD